ncbi:MAG: GNAT family N-acetyltransferase [Phycisphaerae bacterium]|nr:GNAT family N-acetyltransferase [Phycisphaerae bacterium]
MPHVIVECALASDLDSLVDHCPGKSEDVLRRKIEAGEAIIARLEGAIVGWMTYVLLYDVIPFINELGVIAAHRRKGVGTQLVGFLESKAVEAGMLRIMTSSLADEEGQHFWRKLGFMDVGGVLLGNMGDEALEIFFRKDLVSGEA